MCYRLVSCIGKQYLYVMRRRSEFKCAVQRCIAVCCWIQSKLVYLLHSRFIPPQSKCRSKRLFHRLLFLLTVRRHVHVLYYYLLRYVDEVYVENHLSWRWRIGWVVIWTKIVKLKEYITCIVYRKKYGNVNQYPIHSKLTSIINWVIETKGQLSND